MEDATSTDYEQQRNARVGANQKRMQELGLIGLSRSLSPFSSSRKKSREPSVPQITDRLPKRRSSRLVGTTLPCYTEVKTVKESYVHTDARQIQEEIYTEEHERLLGSCSQEWELFKDGFGEDGTRIYDSVKGKTCHQCRQKTLGLRTWCNQCEALRGQFCGDCLFMRYGENVRETNENKEWVCPGCRGICNCSFCRLKKGWAPTGSMYRLALKLNYKSVAHYLVMTRRGSSGMDGKQNEDELGSVVEEVNTIDTEDRKDNGLDKCSQEHVEVKEELESSAKGEGANDKCTAVKRSLNYGSWKKRKKATK